MKNKILQLGFIGMLMVSCTSKVETTEKIVTANKDSIKNVIEGMEAKYAKGLEMRDINPIMDYYADDIKSFEHEKPTIEGKESMKTMTAEMFKQMPKGMKVTMKPSDMRISSDGALVSETGGYVVTDSLGNKTASGNFMATFEKRDGRYQCVREMVSSEKNEEKPEPKK